jgi:hypothetical protein
VNPPPINQFDQFKQAVEKDPFLRFLIALYYQMTVQSVNVIMDVDSVSEEVYIYASVKCISSQTVFNTYSSQLGLFAEDIGRTSNTVSSGCYPFHIYNLMDRMNPDFGKVNVDGVVTYRLRQSNGTGRYAHALSPYALTVEITIANDGEIKEQLPNFGMTCCDEIAGKLFEVVRSSCETIQRRAAPSGFLKLGFRYYIINEPTYTSNSICLDFVLLVDTANEWQIIDINQTAMSIRLRDYDKMEYMVAHADDIDWEPVYNVWGQIATALMSDYGTLMIPSVADHDIDKVDEKWYFKVHMNPHLACFTDEVNIYGQTEILHQCSNEFYWLHAKLPGNVTFAFPNMTTLRDREVLAYLRIPKALPANDVELMNDYVTKFSSADIRIRICAETGMYLYCALVDNTWYADAVKDNRAFKCMNDCFLGHVVAKKPSSNEEAIKSLIGAFAHSEGISGPVSTLNGADYKTGIEECGDDIHLIFDIYEDAIRMYERSWFKDYERLREELIEEVGLAPPKLEEAKDEPNEAPSEPEHVPVPKSTKVPLKLNVKIPLNEKKRTFLMWLR